MNDIKWISGGGVRYKNIKRLHNATCNEHSDCPLSSDSTEIQRTSSLKAHTARLSKG